MARNGSSLTDAGEGVLAGARDDVPAALGKDHWRRQGCRAGVGGEDNAQVGVDRGQEGGWEFFFFAHGKGSRRPGYFIHKVVGTNLQKQPFPF
jgi:hypothetical protein